MMRDTMSRPCYHEEPKRETLADWPAETFARELYSRIHDLAYDELIISAPKEYAAYTACLRRLQEQSGDDPDKPGGLTELDELALAYAGEAFWEGLRYGLASEQFRRGLVEIHE